MIPLVVALVLAAGCGRGGAVGGSGDVVAIDAPARRVTLRHGLMGPITFWARSDDVVAASGPVTETLAWHDAAVCNLAWSGSVLLSGDVRGRVAVCDVTPDLP